MCPFNSFTHFYFCYRIPDGSIDQGPAAGRVHALEEQLIKAKEQMENYKQQTGDGLYRRSFFKIFR